MSSPHPKGPRIFRNLFEPTLSHLKNPEPTTMSSSVADRNRPRISRTSAQAIDLTNFAGRFPAPSRDLTSGFELPRGFFSRLKGVHPAMLATIDYHPLTAEA